MEKSNAVKQREKLETFLRATSDSVQRSWAGSAIDKIETNVPGLYAAGQSLFTSTSIAKFLRKINYDPNEKAPKSELPPPPPSANVGITRHSNTLLPPPPSRNVGMDDHRKPTAPEPRTEDDMLRIIKTRPDRNFIRVYTKVERLHMEFVSGPIVRTGSRRVPESFESVRDREGIAELVPREVIEENAFPDGIVRGKGRKRDFFIARAQRRLIKQKGGKLEGQIILPTRAEMRMERERGFHEHLLYLEQSSALSEAQLSEDIQARLDKDEAEALSA
ncbi:MAG: hypothetical protein ACHQX1_00650 [Candidatus Micrarchaeales archaeon]